MTPLHVDAILECGLHKAEPGGAGNGGGKDLGLDLTSLGVSGEAKAHGGCFDTERWFAPLNIGSTDTMLNERSHTYSIQVKLETGKMILCCQAPNGSPLLLLQNA